MESDRPLRFSNPSCRYSDDYADIREIEYYCDQGVESEPDIRDLLREFSSSYDESQALEIVAADGGWIHGEKFYAELPPRFEDRDMFVQDFGFRPYQNLNKDVFWRSMVEDEPEIKAAGGDLLSPDFFQQRQKPQKPENFNVIIAGAVLGVMPLLRKEFPRHR